MKHSLPLFILCSLLATQVAFAQAKCKFQIDSVKILGNQNLGSFLDHLEKDSFTITNDKKDIPDFIRKELVCHASDFKLANPDEAYQATDVVVEKDLPSRQLIFLAKSRNVLVLVYNIGGVGVSSHVVLIRHEQEKIIDLWKGSCYMDIRNIKGVVRYLGYYQEKNIRKRDDYIYF